MCVCAGKFESLQQKILAAAVRMLGFFFGGVIRRVNEFEFFFYFVCFRWKRSQIQARWCSQNVEERVRAGKNQPQRLDPPSRMSVSLSNLLCPPSFSICLHLALTGEGQSIDLLFRLPERAVKIVRAPSLRTPTVFRPCYDINQQPASWLLVFKNASISINVNNMYERNTHTCTCTPTHLGQAFST